MKCEYCDIIEEKNNLLYEDDDVVVAVRDVAVTPGQISVIPKQHFTIFEQVPPDIVTKCSIMANKVSVSVFEGLGSQGTNIIVKNGTGAGQTVPHFAMDIIPRQEEDGLNLQWQSKQLMEDEMDMAFSTLKDALNPTAITVKKVKDESVKPEKVKEEKGKENYMLKSLKRIP
ncbi:HIT family protein [Candidatus Woesearchaeota archaeon]|jgi:diadenosine tetraphosphate (Ap4A) HIT family hydrolase|nr:HIT family protein [Candidatus Woesearchaeota archaeon]MBT5396596.1 HIT family protein [Candidatus Woesearchaeota archaeon]MBT6367990.1 HIT family protein [Candidatus Woesearchaeota archaeon]MBT7762238.1 HIT family protein [Candidatus Woesearchaeota archaeon]